MEILRSTSKMATYVISGNDKIRKNHLDRAAYLYIRQSSPTQVRQNLESKRRQYELQSVIEALGWPPQNIVVLDDDLGRSANGTHKRQGFASLCGEVCQGRVGLIMSIETSRLARTNREWYHLLDLCAVCQTVVAEPGRIYDPSDHDDRLHLGMKGLLNEAELDRMRSRLLDAAREKAQRGALEIKLPVGLVYGPDGGVCLDPDESVQHAVRSVIEKLLDLGSARKVLRWMLENGLKMPRRIGSGLLSKVRWQEPTYAAVRDLLRNPRYAGAYVYGKSEAYLKIREGEPRHFRRAVPLENWKVVISQAHPGYIGWEQFLSHQQRLRDNSTRKPGACGAPGRGEALLCGLLRCGKCGSRMQVAYRIRPHGDGKSLKEIYYRCCSGASRHLTPLCQRVAARAVDWIVRDAFFKAIEPAELDVSMESMRKLQERSVAAERHWQLALERTRYEAERSRRQYDRVEPENRTVARELERCWEQQLQDLKRQEEEYACWKKERNQSWSEEQILELQALVKDVPALWKAETTKNEDRKELLRLLVQDVWVSTNRKERRLEVKIVWRGGCRTAHQGQWSLSGHVLEQQTMARLRALSTRGLSDERIACELNREGHRRSDGKAFVRHNVTHARLRHSITKSSPPREPEFYNLKEAAKTLSLSSACLRNWMRDGLLTAERDLETREWIIRLSQEDIARLSARFESEAEWTLSQAASRLGVPWIKVYKWVSRGKLQTRQVKLGERKRLLVAPEEVKALYQRLEPCEGKQVNVDVAKEVQDET